MHGVLSTRSLCSLASQAGHSPLITIWPHLMARGRGRATLDMSAMCTSMASALVRSALTFQVLRSEP